MSQHTMLLFISIPILNFADGKPFLSIFQAKTLLSKCFLHNQKKSACNDNELIRCSRTYPQLHSFMSFAIINQLTGLRVRTTIFITFE